MSLFEPRTKIEREALEALIPRKKRGPFDYDTYFDTAHDARWHFVHKYTWAIPSEKALAKITEYAPIVEIGAGAGFWAMMLKNRGVNIVAFDRMPPNLGTNTYTEKNLWFPVQPGDVDVLERYPDRTLLISWPPMTSFAWSALEAYRGRHVIYIGEGWSGCTASDEFHEMLKRDFEHVESVNIPTWPGYHDDLSVWRRK